MDHRVIGTPNSSHTSRTTPSNGSTGAQDTTESSSTLISGNNVTILGGQYNLAQRDIHIHHVNSAKHGGFERAVNDLAKGVTLETVKLTPYFCASIRWKELPSGFEINFSNPIVVGYCGSPVLAATAGMISSDHQPHNVPLSLPDKTERSFQFLASDILTKDNVELTLRGDFSLADNKYNLDAKMSLDGLNSLQDAITLDDVKILSRVEDGLSASVKATIANRTRINIEHVILKSADILYNSTKIGYHKDQKFELLHKPNTPNTPHPEDFFWIFTPPLATDANDDFRGFISKFLTTEEPINITLDLKRIQIKAGDRLVELDGIKVNTRVKGIGKPLITRVDIYLGLNALRQEVSFRFRLENPIHAPIEVIDSVVDAKFNGHLLTHFVHSFKHLSVSKPLGEQDSEVVTAKLKKNLLRTIWLVRGRTKISLEVNIQKTKISIGGREIHNLEFKLRDVESRIHFGKPAAASEESQPLSGRFWVLFTAFAFGMLFKHLSDDFESWRFWVF